MRRKQMHWIVAASLAAIAVGSSGLACAHSGGGGGGGHGSSRGGGHHGRGYHGRGVDGGGNPGGGWRWHGGDDGQGWYSGRFYGGSGGFRYGLLFASIPWYCETYWWAGVPYYYADDNYYQWNDSAGAYETVQPPPELVDQVQTQEPRRELFIFPAAGQSNEQLARDREDCHRWAVAQVGFDPRVPAAGAAGTAATSSSSADSTVAKRMEYLRADGACLMDRNYTVE
jgi:hypothetical protein